MSVTLSTGSFRPGCSPTAPPVSRATRKGGAGQPARRDRVSGILLTGSCRSLWGMEATPETGIGRLARTPTRVVIDAAGPPILNEAAAGVLLRILLRAADRDGMTNVAHSAASAVRSDS